MLSNFSKNIFRESNNLFSLKKATYSFLKNEKKFIKFSINGGRNNFSMMTPKLKKNFSTEGGKNQNQNTENKSQQNEQESENQSENTQEETQNEEQQSKVNYKTSRKIYFQIKKLIKLGFTIGAIIFLLNLYLFYYKEDPTKSYFYVGKMYDYAAKFAYYNFLLKGSLTLPFYKKVLPDALELVGQPVRKTLVINLNKTLINYQYKFGSGFEILKRPGLLKFLQEMGQLYEVVIFGSEDSNFVEEVCHKLDQYEMNIKYKIGKEATRMDKGKYVKDLNYLNRDLKNVIVIDYDPDHVKFHPSNAVIIPEFQGDGTDRELLQSIVFLKEIAKPDVKDVRKEIEKYGNFKPYINFYKSDPKYKKLLPREYVVKDDIDLQAVIKEKGNDKGKIAK
jgi:hypothetical protein